MCLDLIQTFIDSLLKIQSYNPFYTSDIYLVESLKICKILFKHVSNYSHKYFSYFLMLNKNEYNKQKDYKTHTYKIRDRVKEYVHRQNMHIGCGSTHRRGGTLIA